MNLDFLFEFVHQQEENSPDCGKPPLMRDSSKKTCNKPNSKMSAEPHPLQTSGPSYKALFTQTQVRRQSLEAARLMFLLRSEVSDTLHGEIIEQ